MSRKVWVGLAVCSALLLHQFFHFNVVQDDAFISFRYVRNFLDGNGLVFNIGERVEGYTNFLWIILLAFLTKLGLPLIAAARGLGVFAALGTLGLAGYAAYREYPQRSWFWPVGVALLLAACGSLAYWSGSGLETGLFALLAAGGGIFYLSRPALSLACVIPAALTRPEGILLAFLFGVAGLLLKQKSVKSTLIYWVALGPAVLPHFFFKWSYYGALFPSPFYAKTGFSAEYWQSGLEYFFHFLKNYGLFGATLAVPLFFWKKLSAFSRFFLLIFAGYTLYIVSVGGDVLWAHRFFVPVLVFLYFPFADAAHQFFENRPFGRLALGLFFLLAAAYSYRAPLAYLKTSAAGERGLISRMIAAARFFAGEDTAKTFALSSIGAFGYHVGNQRVIDMLGLTEPAIARNPETVEGLVNTWKERRFNAGYVLSQKPEVIYYPTRFGPHSPAEKALFLYPDFRRNYRLDFFYAEGGLDMYYRRFQNKPVPSPRDFPAEFVNLYCQSLNERYFRNFPQAFAHFRQCFQQGPKDFSVLYILLGDFYSSAGAPDSAEACFKRAIELDGGGSVGRYYYRNLLYRLGRKAEAARQDSILLQTAPQLSEYLRTLGQGAGPPQL